MDIEEKTRGKWAVNGGGGGRGGGAEGGGGVQGRVGNDSQQAARGLEQFQDKGEMTSWREGGERS